MTKKALITGITGQDGSYLAEFLLKKKYQVHGLIRRVAAEDKTHRLWRLKNILNKITLHAASLESYASIVKSIQKIKPKEVYHLGAQSYIDYAFKDEFFFTSIQYKWNSFYSIRYKRFSPKTKFYFAASQKCLVRFNKFPKLKKHPLP